jgi:hypothetical protein
LSASIGVPVTVTAWLIASVNVTVWPTPRSPLDGDSAIEMIAGGVLVLDTVAVLVAVAPAVPGASSLKLTVTVSVPAAL